MYVSKHLKILGTIEVIHGALHVITFLGIGAMSLLGFSICAAADSVGEGVAAGTAWGVLWGVIGIVGALLSGVVVIAGLALSNGRGWAKIATIIFALVVIAEFPLGTAFAIYAGWAIFLDKGRGY